MNVSSCCKPCLSICVILMVWQAPTLADTPVGGLIIGDTIWTQADSPYIVQDSVVVINEATLTIEAGAEIRFQPGLRLEVATGRLVARGTSDNRILFTEHQTGQPWQRILFNDGAADAVFDVNGGYSGGSIIDYAIVEYAGAGGVDGAIAANSSAPFISNSIIQNNGYGAISLFRSDSARIVGNEIQYNWPHPVGVVYLNESDHVELTRNIISENRERSNPAHAAVRVRNSDSLAVDGGVICRNATWGLLFSVGSDYAQLSIDLTNPTLIQDNAGWDIVNNNSFAGYDLSDGGNVDARNVYWGVTDPATIATRINDYVDNPSQGIVFFEPWANWPGDADMDGDVDLDDFVILKQNFGTGTTWGEGDFDLDGDVDLDDFVILKKSFGTAAPP